ncbi:hypothetical protein TWF481_010317 [Arthrobotrys musiformis]|uniref:Nucleoside phosphorylase domain-containing protein n=1 Tax=Arthrobotrys musiformis TaxID=47236 RepID=A0AAV9W0H6_9PEZI
MSAADLNLLELAEEALPLVGNVAIKLGLETKKSVFGKLGALLVLVAEVITTIPHWQVAIYENKVKTILEKVERACAWPKVANTTGYPTLEDMVVGRHTGKAQKKVDICRGLREFSLRTHEFEDLLTVLEQVKTVNEVASANMGLELSQMNKEDNVPGYPRHVNEALYMILDLHTSCRCTFQHLKLARLRLDSIDQYDRECVPFELLFPRSPSHNNGLNPRSDNWHETMITVSRKRIGRKQAPSNTWTRKQQQRIEGEVLSIGDFCEDLNREQGFCLRFNLTLENLDPILRRDGAMEQPLRNINPANSLSLADFIRKIGGEMTVREKFHLAYVLAKSVWQYYGTDWMRNPWTHDSILFLEGRAAEKGDRGIRSSYYPYFTPDFEESGICTGEYCADGILIQRYPAILALAIMLIEVIQGQPLNGDEHHRPYDKPKLRERYGVAWKATASLDCNIIYKEVVKRCLDGRLFEEAPFDNNDPRNGLEIRQSILYREIVFPLKRLLILSGVSPDTDRPKLQLTGRATESEALIKLDDSSVPHRNDSHFMRPEDPTTPSYKRGASGTNPQFYKLNADIPQLQKTFPRNKDPVASPETSRRPSRPSNRSEFEIAIICALKLEYDAVSLLIDEYWDDEGDPYGRAPGDQNTYTTCRIGRHNIVLALLPNMGKSNAARVATNFRSSYEGLQLALLVGVCGGVPKDREGNEILLGDVIISASIFEYDFGRRFPSEFRSKYMAQECIGKANADVRGLIATLGTDHNSQRLRLRTLYHLTSLQRKSQFGKYDYPGISEDKLFESKYRHKHHSLNCDICNQCTRQSDHVCQKALDSLCSELQCDESRLVHRRRLELKGEATRLGRTDEAQQPLIHFGLVASGDTVMKSGEDRDMIAGGENIIAFEMEGAGILDSLSCIVIKGVCDYADSHKNKKWQNFAAATAASAMKSLLERYGRTDRHYRSKVSV